MNIPKDMMMKIVGGGLVVAALFFFLGFKIGQGHSSKNTQFTRAGMMNGQGVFTSGRMGGGMRGTGFTGGTILSMDDKSITIKLPDGGSKIVYFSQSTVVSKSVTGGSSDLVVGANISVNGQANQDGSIGAQSIQIRPAQTAVTLPVIPQ